MASESKSKCTLAICHDGDIKTTLYEILDRMNCTIREVSSLEDLLSFLQSSEFSRIDLSDRSDDDPLVLPADFQSAPSAPPHDAPGKSRTSRSKSKNNSPNASVYRSQFLTIAELDKVYIERTLAACGGNRKSAAKLLGIDRTTLYRKIKKYGIDGTSPVE